MQEYWKLKILKFKEVGDKFILRKLSKEIKRQKTSEKR